MLILDLSHVDGGWLPRDDMAWVSGPTEPSANDECRLPLCEIEGGSRMSSPLPRKPPRAWGPARLGVPENERRDIDIGTCACRKCSGEGMGEGVALWSAYMPDDDEGAANSAAAMGYPDDGGEGLPGPRAREG